MNNWKIFKGLGEESPDDNPLQNLPKPPPWRNFSEWKERRGRVLRLGENEKRMINAALYLRRPLLVTGPPGCGKSSIAYAVATELKLGEVLRWSINSRSTVREGLYEYDAIARLRDANLEQGKKWKLWNLFGNHAQLKSSQESNSSDIGRYIRLAPLGTALLPRPRPNVLLIDEIDKADIDLPNDLLHVLEEGAYEIPELNRMAKQKKSVLVRQYIDGSAEIKEGRVQCDAFPYIVISSNGERELPPAFLRRCLRLDIKLPGGDELLQIVMAHLEKASSESTEMNQLVAQFMAKLDEPSQLATDQLLNAAFLILYGKLPADKERDEIIKAIFRDLGQ